MPETETATRYTLSVTKEQLRILESAADLLARIHVGQFDAISWELDWTTANVTQSPDWQTRREDIKFVLEAAAQIYCGRRQGIATHEAGARCQTALNMARKMREAIETGDGTGAYQEGRGVPITVCREGSE